MLVYPWVVLASIDPTHFNRCKRPARLPRGDYMSGRDDSQQQGTRAACVRDVDEGGGHARTGSLRVETADAID